MGKENSKLLVISPAAAVLPQQIPSGDRLGGHEHGFVERALSAFQSKPIDPDVFSDRLYNAIAKATGAVQAKVSDTLGAFIVDEVVIKLAVSADGDIGIASAGVEASIEVT